jgi:putative endonuclease
MSLTIGLAGEDQARDFLTQQGLIWVESNFRCRLGEIDLIMRHHNYLVFVEVRQRGSSAFGGALASITRQKQKKIIKAATLYLQSKRLMDSVPIRFDVVTLEGKPPKITWIDNAFDASC